MSAPLKLHGYWRSSAAYRVRIALNLKHLPYESVPVHLVRNGGEQRQSEFLALNPQGLVPVLIDGEQVITQSLAIIEYLDERHPTPPLLPESAIERAQVRALANLVACDIHPLNNLRVLQYLERELGAAEAQRLSWMQHWMTQGFDALETRLGASNASFCHGDAPGLADCCLIPQLYNARRFGMSLEAWPKLQRIEANCLSLPAFQHAAPEAQPDASA